MKNRKLKKLRLINKYFGVEKALGQKYFFFFKKSIFKNKKLKFAEEAITKIHDPIKHLD